MNFSEEKHEAKRASVVENGGSLAWSIASCERGVWEAKAGEQSRSSVEKRESESCPSTMVASEKFEGEKVIILNNNYIRLRE